MGGDFKCPGIDWSSGNLTNLYISGNFRVSLLSLVQEFLFDQNVSQPTRGKNIFDLCFTSHPGHIFKNCNVVPGLSDLNAVIIELLNSWIPI